MILGARSGPPLAVGHGEGEMFLGSDAIALAPFTDEITYLDDGDWAVMTREPWRSMIHRHAGRRPRQTGSQGAAYVVDKGNHRHFMEKEIHEQPEVVSHTLSHYIDFAEGRVQLDSAQIDFANLDRLAMSACGTAYYAGLIGKYWFERFARLPVEIDVASEFRYREMPIAGRMAALFISQSGETADTLASLRYCRDNASDHRRGGQCPRIDHCARVRCRFPDACRTGNRRGLDQGLHLPALGAGGAGDDRRPGARHALGGRRNRDGAGAGRRRRACSTRCCDRSSRSRRLSRELARFKDVLYLGRGTSFRWRWKAR
jgi:glucosamine--fructose-6-phosphate aminotransferase (isomerizing)